MGPGVGRMRSVQPREAQRVLLVLMVGPDGLCVGVGEGVWYWMKILSGGGGGEFCKGF